MNTGKSAPGIVFERLIHGLSLTHTVDLLTADYSPSFELSSVKNVIEIKNTELHYRLQKLLISIFKINPTDLLWTKKAISTLDKRKHAEYDIILSFISFNHYAPVIAGNRLSKKLKTKHMVYLVDALPPPIGWLNNNSFYRATKALIAKQLSQVDGIFSANRKMLNYQLANFKAKKDIVTGVIYNPHFGTLQVYKSKSDQPNSFLYTGGIYGPRKPDYVLQAFKKVLKKYPSSILEFVGSELSEESFSGFNDDERSKVIIHPFTRDLGPYYERATALIDIDAILPDDVFLSSKITNYITINRIIISETGENSPSREIFKNIPSILQCGHDADEIADAMCHAIQQQNTVDFNDRKDVIAIFDLKAIVDKLTKSISA